MGCGALLSQDISSLTLKPTHFGPAKDNIFNPADKWGSVSMASPLVNDSVRIGCMSFPAVITLLG